MFIKDEEKVKVVGLYHPPWFMTTAEDSSDEETYEGFLVDMMNEISKRINVKFNISLAKSNFHGIRNESGHWNGLIGEVMQGRADLGIADLTITPEREKAVDFSLPFAHTGIGVLMKRPPYYITSNDSDVRASKTRPLIIYPVSSIEDLTKQGVVKYGALQYGSTFNFFNVNFIVYDIVIFQLFVCLLQTSTNPIYKKIGEYLSKQSYLPQSYGEAAHEVYESDGKYMFFMEETSIDYLTGKDCDYARLDENVGDREFGIAMRKGYHLKSRINSAINDLQEEGFLKQLMQKWFSSPLACNIQIERIYKRNILDLVINGLK
ncbi:glutamate receptor 3-like protein [Leptotrombidium deliense]|uniref:Glutamate receptor 3-like protein n=1 Tax=Leptotrombidium deliense TaxID=299467 RepID=A0A443S5S4_9ACAR|nr:glutamate receptor 3-like protein [Leptotrombidium deliense]